MNKLKYLFKTYPITRGIAVYSILSPASNATQQMFDPKKEKVNPKECLRFGILGTLIVAPTIYGWLKIANVLVKGNTLKHCIFKAYIEQILWAPYAYCQFFVGINLLEGKSLKESIDILKEKFWPTYKVGFCLWPVIQTVNFKLIAEKNRVPFISVCAFAWNVFLSYMHNRTWNENYKQKH